MFVKVSDLTKIYNSSTYKVKALDDVSFEMEKGKIYVVFGPSGSGKSTLLNILGGIDTATSGEVEVDGLKITNLNISTLTPYRREKVGFIFQFYNLVQTLTVYENVLSTATLVKNPLDVDEVLKMVDIYDLKDKYPSELSGGQQQRVAIARAVVKNPAIILCDEPTGALDFESAKQVLNLFEKINQNYNTTIIIVTHNTAIAGMAHGILRLRSGKLIEFKRNQNPIKAVEVVW